MLTGLELATSLPVCTLVKIASSQGNVKIGPHNEFISGHPHTIVALSERG